MTAALAVAEAAFEFEHRDLHWGNILLRKTSEKLIHCAVDSVPIQIPSSGIKISIIDFTLSRLHKGMILFRYDAW